MSRRGGQWTPISDEGGPAGFSAIDPALTQAGELAGAISDAKGGSAALRMSSARMRALRLFANIRAHCPARRRARASGQTIVMNSTRSVPRSKPGRTRRWAIPPSLPRRTCRPCRRMRRWRRSPERARTARRFRVAAAAGSCRHAVPAPVDHDALPEVRVSTRRPAGCVSTPTPRAPRARPRFALSTACRALWLGGMTPRRRTRRSSGARSLAQLRAACRQPAPASPTWPEPPCREVVRTVFGVSAARLLRRPCHAGQSMPCCRACSSISTRSSTTAIAATPRPRRGRGR